MRYNELTFQGRNAVLEAFRSGKTIDKLFILDGCQVFGKNRYSFFIREGYDRCIFLIDETPEIFLILDCQKTAAEGWP